MRPSASHSLSIACAVLACAAAVQAERAPFGIAVDVELGRALKQIEADSGKETELAARVSELETREHAQLDALKTRVRTLYRLTHSGMAPVSGGFEAVRQHVARVHRLKSLVERDAGELSAVHEQGVAARSEHEQLLNTLAQARVRLTALQTQQAASALDFESERAPQPKAETSSAEHGFYGLRFSEGGPNTAFETLRGKLAAPVSGEVRVSDAGRSPAEGPALLFEAPAGTPVRAAAAGRVVYCDRHGSYGLLVVVDHGGGYYTAYGGLGGVEVRAGDDLSTYARIGNISNEGPLPALIFEVRKGNRAVSPRVWLGL